MFMSMLFLLLIGFLLNCVLDSDIVKRNIDVDGLMRDWGNKADLFCKDLFNRVMNNLGLSEYLKRNNHDR